MFLLHFKTAWNDYFPGTSPTYLPSQTYTFRQTPSNTYLYVLNCLFSSITSTGYGGALYCTSVTYLLVESTSFFSCKTSGGRAGAIYFSNSSGQCVLHEVCGYDCCTTDSTNSNFVYTSVNNDILSKNYINYSSISRCVNENSQQSLFFNYGKIFCLSINLSNNKCKGEFVLYYPISYSNTITCSFSYSSFADNTASQNTCLILWTTGAEYEIKSCNILRNTQGNLNYRGTISTIGNLKIVDSCILENIATYIFYQESSSYRITLSNCTVDKTSNNGRLTTQNTVTKSFILALNHMSTRNCQSEYDVAGTLTPIIQTHSPSSSKKQIYCCTCQIYRLQLRDEDIVSLISILIFNFIHLDASIDSFY
jgi:predicted outer membrane repeat protein